MRRLILVLAAMGFALVLSGGVVRYLGVAGAQESTGGEASQETGWQETEDKSTYPLENATTETIQGVPLDNGGCRFTATVDLSSGEPVVERTLAVNQDTCEVRVEEGTPVDTVTAAADTEQDSADWGALGDSGASTFDDTSGTAPTGEVGTAATKRHARGYLRTWAEDPINLKVNQVRNTTDWHYNGSSVVSPVYGYYRYRWRQGTGWTLEGHDFNNYYTSFQSTSSSRVHFRNHPFCDILRDSPQPATHVYYDRNKVNGRYNGDLVWSFRTWDSGGCANNISVGHYQAGVFYG